MLEFVVISLFVCVVVMATSNTSSRLFRCAEFIAFVLVMLGVGLVF